MFRECAMWRECFHAYVGVFLNSVCESFCPFFDTASVLLTASHLQPRSNTSINTEEMCLP